MKIFLGGYQGDEYTDHTIAKCTERVGAEEVGV